jgi:hypothetical protein
MGYTKIIGPETIGGADKVYVDGPTSTFGDVRTITIRPQGQGDFVYGISTEIFTTSSFAGGTVTQVSGVCELSSGTNPAGSATVQLRRGLKYRPGQGSLMRVTALYGTPDAGNAQFIGAGNAECGYFVGYFGTSFGILHSQTGQREVRKLTITTGAGTGDVTVTLDGNSIVVPVTGGGSPEQTAYELSKADYSQVGNGGWLADPISGSVFYIAARANSTSTGSYSVAGSSIVGSFERTKAGEAQTNTFITQSSFNQDKLDGNGPTGMTLDPTKGNVFEIDFQYLGFGNASFNIEDPETGKPACFHIIKNANSRTTPVLKNPNVLALATSANIGGTTSTKLKTASIASFIEGEVVELDPKFSKSFAFSGVNTATYRPLSALKVNRIFNNESCFGEFDILRLAGSNTVNNQAVTIGFFLGARLSGEVNYQYVNEQNSVVSYAELLPTGAGFNTIENLADLTPIYELVVASDSSLSIDISQLKLTFGIGRDLIIAIKTTASVTGFVSINWFEQQ